MDQIGTAEFRAPLGQGVARYVKSLFNVDLLRKFTRFSTIPGWGLNATVSKIEELCQLKLNSNNVYVQTDREFNSTVDQT